MRKIFITVIIAFLPAAHVLASGGLTPVTEIGIGVRAQALGLAFTAVPDDSSSVFFNPSLLHTIKKTELQAAYIPLFFDTVYNFAVMGVPTIEFGSYGVSVARISTSDITFRDNKGFELSTVSQDITEIIAAWGMTMFNDDFYAGFAAKVNNHSIGDISDTGFGIDLAYAYRLINNKSGTLFVGLAVKNILSPVYKLGIEQENLPRIINAGASMKRNFSESFSVLASAEASIPVETEFTMRGGVEAGIFKTVFLRAGYNTDEIASIGAGIELFGVGSIDYGMFFTPLNSQHRFSAKFRIGSDIAVERLDKELLERKRIERKARELAIEELAKLRKDLDKIKKDTRKQEYFKALHYSRGLEKYYNGDLESALIEFETVKQADADYMSNRYYISLLNRLIKDRKGKTYSEDILSIYRAGVSKYLKENYKGAKAEWEKILKIDPYNKLAIENLNEVNSLIRDIESIGE